MPSHSDVAVVTGASRGLGRAVALAFARAGWPVAATARSAGPLAALADEARAASLALDPHVGDVTRVDDNRRLAGRLAADGRRVGAVVHNAGLLGPARTPLADYPPEEFARVMAANVFGPFDLTRQLLPLLAPGAALLFVSSGASLGPRPGWGAYNVSKMALDGLAALWAAELGDRDVRVYTVDPGRLRTAMRAAAYPEEDPATLPAPEQVAPAFLWLAEHGHRRESGQRVQASDVLRRLPRQG